ncbi:MAG: hypothetical protein KDA61_06375 [Planctomycetales bacterium]|nr:hypothetical protein [Planctomycetales bacterium]
MEAVPPHAATPILAGRAQRRVGEIPQCADADCGRTCCDFSRGNYILLYPGELEAAVATGESVAHLQCEPFPEGGHRAICSATNQADCDGGYKPLDCASYPFFPTLDHAGGVAVELKGAKCPLQSWMLAKHARWVRQTWQKILVRHRRLATWIAAARLVGYERCDDASRGVASNSAGDVR